MAFDNNRKEERRRLRQQQVARAKKQRKQAFFALSCAVFVLIACAVIIFGQKPAEQAVTMSAPETTAAASSTQATETVPETTEEPLEPETVITIAAAGDLNISDKVLSAVSNDGSYTDLFMDVAPLLSDADWTIVNLEGTVGNAPYGGMERKAPASVLTALRRAGVDMIQLANSTSVADGLIGLSNTRSAVLSAGMEPVGTFPDNATYKKTGGYTLMDIRGVKIAFVAFTKGMDGMGLPTGSETCVNLLYKDYATTYKSIDYDRLNTVMKNVRAANADLTVVLLHWGSEYNDQISGSQETLEEYFLENGADAIIGTHSHYVQEMKLEDGKFVAYSLGDFVSDGDHAGTDYSVVLKLTIRKDNRTGETTIEGYDYTPICVVEEAGILRVKRLDQTIFAYESRYIDRISEEKYNSLVYNRTRVEERIHPED